VNDIVNDQPLTHLGPAETRLAAAIGRPRTIALTCIVSLAALGWGACAFLQADVSPAWANAFCLPALGGNGLADAALLFGMWAAMTLAMMVPTAGPMILTYAEIADTAARRAETVVSPLVLTAGYVVVWLTFAAAAALLQWLTIMSIGAPAVPRALAGLVLVGVGLYQFSPLKSACLARCQRPFPFFFANWTNQTRGIFRLGLHQGLHCLGCCWALMVLMFTAGAMNVIWMAGLGVAMTVEKLSTTNRFSRALGAVLMALGVATLVLEFR
jgi:predicted metal-binding membrane protein